jgi:hypothetical protein
MNTVRRKTGLRRRRTSRGVHNLHKNTGAIRRKRSNPAIVEHKAMGVASEKRSSMQNSVGKMSGKKRMLSRAMEKLVR